MPCWQGHEEKHCTRSGGKREGKAGSRVSMTMWREKLLVMSPGIQEARHRCQGLWLEGLW